MSLPPNTTRQNASKNAASSNWRSVRAIKSRLTNRILERHSLRWHAFWIGLLTLVTALCASAVLKSLWPQGWLSIRYAIVLGIAYGVYLLLVRLWAGYMARRSQSDSSSGDIPTPDGAGNSGGGGGKPSAEYASGKGGDFGGGGAQGKFDLDASPADSVVSDVASAGLEAAAGADEAAVVIVPVMAVFAGLALLLGAAGWMVILIFGIDVLLAVTVEIAFASLAGRTLFQIAQHSWWETAVALSWKPMLGSVLLAVALGAVIDIWLPQASSLPEAIKLVR
jgi:uncharacterized membrane protein YgcG